MWTRSGRPLDGAPTGFGCSRSAILAFDDQAFEPFVSRARASGVGFTTMADLGDTAENRRALYELNKTCAAGLPERGTFYTYEEHLAHRVDVSTFDPGGVALALRGAEWIGRSFSTLCPGPGFAFNEMTSVLAPDGGQGLSLAMKLLDE